MTDKHYVEAENAERIWEWLQTRGGIAIWHSADLSDPGKTWTTPALEAGGEPMKKQSWQMENEPRRIITDPAEVEVHVPKEVKRFYVAIQPRRGGLRWELSDGATRRVRAAVKKANDEHCNGEELAWYEFDYGSQEAVILVPDRQVLIQEFMNESSRSEGARTTKREHADRGAGDSEGSSGS